MEQMINETVEIFPPNLMIIFSTLLGFLLWMNPCTATHPTTWNGQMCSMVGGSGWQWICDSK